jgi:hypothetical protein
MKNFLSVFVLQAACDSHELAALASTLWPGGPVVAAGRQIGLIQELGRIELAAVRHDHRADAAAGYGASDR